MRGGFPRLYAAASLKLEVDLRLATALQECFPRLYAAASLKPDRRARRRARRAAFSAALCRGLIEATRI